MSSALVDSRDFSIKQKGRIQVDAGTSRWITLKNKFVKKTEWFTARGMCLNII